MIIQHNLLSNFINRQLGISKTSKEKSMEMLGTGYRINRASDNEAGLAISEKMRGQIRGLDQAGKSILERSNVYITVEVYTNFQKYLLSCEFVCILYIVFKIKLNNLR